MAAVAKEINGTVESYHITRSVPMGPKTVLVRTAEGGFEVQALASGRVLARLLVSIVRLTLAAFMIFDGTKFLVYEIGIGDLLLNAGAPSAI